MKLNKRIKDLSLDKRMKEWSTRYNMITQKKYQEHLRALPDLSDQAESMTGDPQDSSQKSKTHPKS